MRQAAAAGSCWSGLVKTEIATLTNPDYYKSIKVRQGQSAAANLLLSKPKRVSILKGEDDEI